MSLFGPLVLAHFESFSAVFFRAQKRLFSFSISFLTSHHPKMFTDLLLSITEEAREEKQDGCVLLCAGMPLFH